MKIYDKAVPPTLLALLLTEIRKGKYEEISEAVVKKEIEKGLRNEPARIEKLEKKKYREPFVKKIKKALYETTGKFTEALTLEDHFSTKERDFSVYKKIFSITGKPKKIVDVGCGVNPLSYEHLECSPEYLAFDVNEQQIQKIHEFFKEKKINGKAAVADIETMTFPKADVYFLFQVLDSVEQAKNHKKSEEILEHLPADWIVVSFGKKTLSGKPMNYPERGWFERLLERKQWSYKRIDTASEVFYVIGHD